MSGLFWGQRVCCPPPFQIMPPRPPSSYTCATFHNIEPEMKQRSFNVTIGYLKVQIMTTVLFLPADDPADSKLDNTELSEQKVYLPNIHPKLISFLKSSTAHRHHLEGEMDRKDMTIAWPTTEDGKCTSTNM